MKKYKKLLSVVLLGAAWTAAGAEKPIELLSPSKEIKVAVTLADGIYYSVEYNGVRLLDKCRMSLTLNSGVLGASPVLLKQERSAIAETLKPVVPMKFAVVKNNCNVLRLRFKGDYSVEVRAYDDGAAYRFVADKKGEVEVMSEEVGINFAGNWMAHVQPSPSFKATCEEEYKHTLLANIARSEMVTLPVLVDAPEPYKIFVSESDVTDYPCMFMNGTQGNGLGGVFPRVPLTFVADGDRSVKILTEANYIAKTRGSRNFPWRYFVLTKNDGDIVINTMTYRLAQPCLLAETAWIKAGQVSWEWWNGACPYGEDVEFETGCNLQTYKYYIDFAAKYGVAYILMDEGWALDTRNPYTPNPKVDVRELIRYGKEKGVGVILWLTWLTVENNFSLFKTYGEWGVAGVKIDFMERIDQWMVNFYERAARAAAENHLIVDFHGAFKPSGLERMYPNILSYEGVRGMEQMGGATPDNSIYLPFMRNAVGVMDYTPGAMISMQPEAYCSRHPNAASIGTRAYQMALYVVFESGLQMLSDNPTNYYRNPDCTEFLVNVPVVWDETRVLAAKSGEYIVVAKRSDNKWWLGGIANGKEKQRRIVVPLDFLRKGVDYSITSFADGPNSVRQAMDYRRRTSIVNADASLDIVMVRNGGYAAVVEHVR